MKEIDLKKKRELDQAEKTDKPKVQVTLEWADHAELVERAKTKGVKTGTLARIFILKQMYQ